MYFAFFSKLVFWVSKTSFAPLFSAISSPIGLKIFLVRLQVIWVGRFFFFPDTFYQSKLAGFAKFLGSQKPRGFTKYSVFWISRLKYLELKKKKKNVHPDWVPLPTVKISGQTDEICGFAGGRNVLQVFELGVSGSPRRRGLTNLCLRQLLLYYSRSIYTEIFRKIHAVVS